jgi:hypothetical protein
MSRIDLRTIRFGIEIEVVGVQRDALANAIVAVLPGSTQRFDGVKYWIRMADGREWTVVNDGSLARSPLAVRGSGEVVSPILTYADMETLQTIVRAVRGAGAKADEHCGMHIHVDGADFDGRGLVNLARYVARREPMLIDVIGVLSHRLAQYTRPVSEEFLRRLGRGSGPSDVAGVNRAWFGQRTGVFTTSRYHQSRYHGLNLNSYFYRKTVEFRYFNGTLHAGEIKGYVQLVLALVADARSKRGVAKAPMTWPGVGSPAAAKESLKVASRVIVNLGLNGPEFETCRHHLLKGLKAKAGVSARSGNGQARRETAFGRPVRAEPEPTPPAPIAAYTEAFIDGYNSGFHSRIGATGTEN